MLKVLTMLEKKEVAEAMLAYKLNINRRSILAARTWLVSQALHRMAYENIRRIHKQSLVKIIVSQLQS
jgi:hypothetical protein